MAVAQIQMRRGTTAEWAAAAPVVLAAGEQGYDSTLGKTKVGDGTTAWASLAWSGIGETEIIDLVYPVGSIYLSVAATSPATLFGGTWVALEDKFLLGAGSIYTAGDTGGVATVELTAAQSGLRAHRHQIWIGNTAGVAGSEDGCVRAAASLDASFRTGLPYNTSGTGNKGYGSTAMGEVSGSAHDNMPPYLVIYMWKRTA